MAEQQRAWVRREERRISPTPTAIPPHPDHGDLPPCEAGIRSGNPCPRPATTHYGYAYYCGEHYAWVEAGEEEDAASLAVYHAKRFLWKAQVEGIDRLEYHLGTALSELEEERVEAEKKAEKAGERAGVPRV